MRLYARQLAWYESRQSEKSEKTRAGELMLSGGTVKFPPFKKAALLVTYLTECGLVASGPMGRAPLSALELSAWATATGAELGPIDFQDMLDASRAYLAAFNEFDKRMVVSPWSPDLTEEEEIEQLAAEQRFFDMLMGVGRKAQ